MAAVFGRTAVEHASNPLLLARPRARAQFLPPPRALAPRVLRARFPSKNKKKKNGQFILF